MTQTWKCLEDSGGWLPTCAQMRPRRLWGQPRLRNSCESGAWFAAITCCSQFNEVRQEGHSWSQVFFKINALRFTCIRQLIFGASNVMMGKDSGYTNNRLSNSSKTIWVQYQIPQLPPPPSLISVASSAPSAPGGTSPSRARWSGPRWTPPSGPAPGAAPVSTSRTACPSADPASTPESRVRAFC